mmetsp:Transcript_86598/g.245151  ORF Transcript_86598/g.245151 Transcript_86598/m.245151 type:complete len:653 (+) Transcript_86598:1017-2975(+)
MLPRLVHLPYAERPLNTELARDAARVPVAQVHPPHGVGEHARNLRTPRGAGECGAAGAALGGLPVLHQGCGGRMHELEHRTHPGDAVAVRVVQWDVLLDGVRLLVDGEARQNAVANRFDQDGGQNVPVWLLGKSGLRLVLAHSAACARLGRGSGGGRRRLQREGQRLHGLPRAAGGRGLRVGVGAVVVAQLHRRRRRQGQHLAGRRGRQRRWAAPPHGPLHAAGLHARPTGCEQPGRPPRGVCLLGGGEDGLPVRREAAFTQKVVSIVVRGRGGGLGRRHGHGESGRAVRRNDGLGRLHPHRQFGAHAAREGVLDLWRVLRPHVELERRGHEGSRSVRGGILLRGRGVVGLPSGEGVLGTIGLLAQGDPHELPVTADGLHLLLRKDVPADAHLHRRVVAHLEAAGDYPVDGRHDPAQQLRGVKFSWGIVVDANLLQREVERVPEGLQPDGYAKVIRAAGMFLHLLDLHDQLVLHLARQVTVARESHDRRAEGLQPVRGRVDLHRPSAAQLECDHARFSLLLLVRKRLSDATAERLLLVLVVEQPLLLLPPQRAGLAQRAARLRIELHALRRLQGRLLPALRGRLRQRGECELLLGAAAFSVRGSAEGVEPRGRVQQVAYALALLERVVSLELGNLQRERRRDGGPVVQRQLQ